MTQQVSAIASQMFLADFLNQYPFHSIGPLHHQLFQNRYGDSSVFSFQAPFTTA